MTRDTRIYLAWVLALVATIGSLYFSEIKGFRPCILCWYQRICMYPLVIILGVAAFRSDAGVRKYALPLSIIGLCVAMFQNLETWGIIPTIKACGIDPSASCGTPWPVWGMHSPLNSIVTIPVLSSISFIAIIALLSWKRETITRRVEIATVAPSTQE